MTIKVFIHIGPPKTATSAIQNWLQKNQPMLLKQGIYYPPHSLDDNGVSSGNVLDVFDRSADKKLSISTEKVTELVQKCEQEKCHTLLLSSEFFFFQVDALKEAFPVAKFITYIRFPLDVIESSYNQAVKRHSETKPLGLPKEPKAYHLDLFDNMLAKHGIEPFIIHFYEKGMLFKGDIVADFCATIGIEQAASESVLVNSSYSYQALEFKRWLNTFLPEDCQHRVDRFLQSYDQGTMSYSLIMPKQYQYYVDWFIQKLEGFFTQYPIVGYEEYLETMRHKSQRGYVKQSMSTDDFKQLLDAMLQWDKGLVYVLSTKARLSQEASEKRADFHQIFCASEDARYKLKLWCNETYLRCAYKLKNWYVRARAKPIDPIGGPVAPLDRVRSILNIDKDLSDGEIYRELALYSEQNGEIALAYRLMKEADNLRPGGPVITAKLSEYQEKLNLRETDKLANR